MALISHITHRQKCAGRQLPLERQHVILGVGHGIAIVKGNIRRDGNYAGKTLRVRISRRDVMRWERQWERVRTLPAIGGVDEGRREEWWRGSEIVVAEWWNAVHDPGRQSRKRSIEDSIARADAAVPTVSKKSSQNSVREAGRGC